MTCSPRRWSAALVTLLTLVGCASPATSVRASPAAAPSSTVKPASPDDPVNQVLAISVDGLNPRAITQLGSAGAPAFHRLMREGAWTFNARTENELTRTLPNHTGMLTGRRIDAERHGHGVTFNSDDGRTVHTAAGHYVASVFDVVHDNGGTTAMYASKSKFAFYSRSWNAHGAADTTGKDNGRAKIDRVTIDTDNARLVAALVAELKQRPRTFTFLHLSLPDDAGHAYGFMSPQYVAAVKQTDRLLGTLLATISARPALRHHLLVMLTADHGGNGPTHSDPTSLHNYRVPFMVWGPGVPAGRNLYQINPTFQAPREARTTYAGKQPIRNGDIANLATDVLDLPLVPGSELDRPRTLDLFGR